MDKNIFHLSHPSHSPYLKVARSGMTGRLQLFHLSLHLLGNYYVVMTIQYLVITYYMGTTIVYLLITCYLAK